MVGVGIRTNHKNRMVWSRCGPRINQLSSSFVVGVHAEPLVFGHAVAGVARTPTGKNSRNRTKYCLAFLLYSSCPNSFPSRIIKISHGQGEVVNTGLVVNGKWWVALV